MTLTTVIKDFSRGILLGITTEYKAPKIQTLLKLQRTSSLLALVGCGILHVLQ